jgi:hypothetical protein
MHIMKTELAIIKHAQFANSLFLFTQRIENYTLFRAIYHARVGRF